MHHHAQLFLFNLRLNVAQTAEASFELLIFLSLSLKCVEIIGLHNHAWLTLKENYLLKIYKILFFISHFMLVQVIIGYIIILYYYNMNANKGTLKYELKGLERWLSC